MIDYYIFRVLQHLKVWDSPQDPSTTSFYNAFPCYHGTHVFAFFEGDWYEGFVTSAGTHNMLVDVGRTTIAALAVNIKNASRVRLTAFIIKRLHELQGSRNQHRALRADIDLLARVLVDFWEPVITLGMLEESLYGKTSYLNYQLFFDRLSQLVVGAKIGTAQEERARFEKKKHTLNKTFDAV